MSEVIIMPCYRREALLACSLRRIREIGACIDIHLFPDRGTATDPLTQRIAKEFDASIHFVPEHDWYGNSANTMNAYLWAYNAGYDFTYLIEEDVFVHKDFFEWHRDMHATTRLNIFASMAWIFNRNAPIADDVMFQPWYYSIGVCFSRKKLELLVPHATPLYYSDMPGYVASHFKKSPLNDPLNISHFEQDGLIQRILDVDRTQTVTPGIAKCSHMGFVRSYGSLDVESEYKRILGSEDFEKQIAKLEELYADPYWRISMFGRPVVERELGHEVPVRNYRYRITIPSGWESEFVSELEIDKLPKRINSVPLSEDAVIEEV
jgi:hypothetical protein